MEKTIFRPGGTDLTLLGASEASLRQSSRVLDIGCGTGTSLNMIHQTYGCGIYGIDLSARAVAAARTVNPDAIILQGEASSLPFENDFFDAVFMECTLTLFQNPLLALKEAQRVLSPKGTLVLLTLSTPTGNQLVSNGKVSLDQLYTALSDMDFFNIRTKDCTQELIQFVVDIIFRFGSVDAYIRQASSTLDGTILNCSVSPKDTGYHLITAQKNTDI